jgi:hypothetical protein
VTGVLKSDERDSSVRRQAVHLKDAIDKWVSDEDGIDPYIPAMFNLTKL